MPDLAVRDLLARVADQVPGELSPPTAARFAELRSRRRRTAVGVAAAVAFVAVIAVVSVLLTGHTTRHGAPAAGTRTATFGDLTVHYPVAWRRVPVTFISAGVEYPLGYLTSEPVVPECRAGCGPPVDGLHPGGVLVSISGSGDTAAPGMEPNGTVAGLPARVVRNSAQGCPGGAASAEDVAVHLPGSMVRLTACFGPNAGAAQQEFDRMIATARYDGSPPAFVHGSVTLSGGPPNAAPSAGRGFVQVYSSEQRTGQPLQSVPLSKTGAYRLQLPPGTYYLSATSAIYNGKPCAAAKPLMARAHADVRFDIVCSRK